jgi:hypothetical protein
MASKAIELYREPFPKQEQALDTISQLLPS